MVKGFVREQDRPLLDAWQPDSTLQPATYNSLVRVAEQHCNKRSCGRLQETLMQPPKFRHVRCLPRPGHTPTVDRPTDQTAVYHVRNEVR